MGESKKIKQEQAWTLIWNSWRIFWSQVSGWRIIGEKFRLNFDSTTAGRTAPLSKCSKPKSRKLLSTVYRHSLATLFRLVDNGIICFPSERAAEVRDIPLGVLWEVVIFWVPIRFYLENCVTARILVLALSPHFNWISQDTLSRFLEELWRANVDSYQDHQENVLRRITHKNWRFIRGCTQ